MKRGYRTMAIRQALIENVGEPYILKYLKELGIKNSDSGDLSNIEWINEIVDKKKVDIPDFQDFLFDELFWGKRKTIRVYKLSDIRKYKYSEDWERTLAEKYNIDSLNFVKIIEGQNLREYEKTIVAIKNNTNDKGELTNLKILYCFGIRNEKSVTTLSLSYVPVEIDFLQKIMVLKAWNRINLNENDRAGAILDKTYNDLTNTFHVKVNNNGYEGKKVLFKMSQNLIQEMYIKVPNYNKIEELNEINQQYIQALINELNLQHVEEKNNKLSLNKGVFDAEDEFKNVIEKMVICDFFYDRPYEIVWKMGIESIISKIKFNDREHVLTWMSGDNS